MIHKLAEQMRQSIAIDAAELVEIKQNLVTRTCSLVAGEELSPRIGEPLTNCNMSREGGIRHNVYAAPTRQTRVDFPRIAGEDL